MTRHIILTGKDGELRGTDAEPLLTRDDIEQMVDDAVAKKRIVIYFHGGLVSESSGLTTAKRLGTLLEGADAYPIFFVWRSGALEIITANVTEIVREELFERMLRRVLAWSVGKVHEATDARAGGVVKATPVELDTELARRRRDNQGEEPYVEESPTGSEELTEEEKEAFVRDAESDQDLYRAVEGAIASRDLTVKREDGSRGAPTVPPVPSKIDDDVLREIADGDFEGQRGLATILTLAKKLLVVLENVLSRYRNGTDSGIYPTVVDEIMRAFYFADVGGGVWQAMKKETFDTFGTGGSRGGRLFLDALADKLPDDGSIEITLVGHSTGAVFIDNFLTEVVRRRKESDHPLPEKTRFQIVLLAPAATSLHFADTLAAAEPSIHRLRMFTMDDVTERADRVAGAVYPRSLLYLVSGAFERTNDKSALTPVLGLARYLEPELKKVLASPLSKSAKLVEVRKFFDTADRIVRSPSPAGAAEGFRATAKSHGDFDDDAEVLDSLVHMVKHW